MTKLNFQRSFYSWCSVQWFYLLLFSTNNISGIYLIVFIQDIDKTIRSKNSGKNLANFKFLLVVQNTFRGTWSCGADHSPSCSQRHVHTHRENILMELLHTVTGGFHFTVQFSSAAQLCPTLCDSHGLQHARLLCPTPTLGDRVGDGHPTISYPVIPFSSCLQSSPASGHFTFISVIFKVCIFAYLAHHENVLKGN